MGEHNADGRQAIFFRQRIEGSSSFLAYSARMIDHGFAFDAQNWQFTDSPERGLYTRREVYKTVTGYESFEPWLSRIRDYPAQILEEAQKKARAGAPQAPLAGCSALGLRRPTTNPHSRSFCSTPSAPPKLHDSHDAGLDR